VKVCAFRPADMSLSGEQLKMIARCNAFLCARISLGFSAPLIPVLTQAKAFTSVIYVKAYHSTVVVAYSSLQTIEVHYRRH
jgi:hypothetical protein